MGAVACAALSEDMRILSEVVDTQAPLDSLVNRRMAFVCDTSPLHMLAQRGQDGEMMLLKLLQLRANPNGLDSYDGAFPLWDVASR